MSTQVRNPSRSNGRTGFTNCSGCGEQFTSMGIARHWPKCEVLKRDPEYQARIAAFDLEHATRPDTAHFKIVEPYAAAIRMIRDAIGELFGPLANLESEEAVLLRGPLPEHDAEAIIAALQNVKEFVHSNRA